jgi:subtilase family serine protease
MKRGFVLVLALVVMAAFAASAQALPHSSAQGLAHRNACGVPAADSARCFAKVVTRDDGSTFSPDGRAGAPAGWWPQDLQAAYNLPTFSGTPTVAIVDAFDDPNAESDLATYRSQFGLPACTSASTGGNGCFKKVNQNGVEGSYPSADRGWSEEIALDLDMVSSACPSCHILLVEASSNSFANLMTAVDRAAVSGVVAISNSYGANEFSGETTYDSHFNHPGIAITVSSGDNGYGAEYPASSRWVTAAGGTSLSTASNARGWSETAWSGAGSGCSAYETKPTWQSSLPSACGLRTVADVSSVSNPNTGVAVYGTYGGDPGWMVFGGTSAAAPFIAGVYAVGGVVGSPTYEASLPYAHTSSLFDVTSGSNGRCTIGKKGSSSSAYLCTAGPGYDGPTGLGTPNGAGAF